MSGGVDSSVAALLLKERGYRVVGVTLRFLSHSAAGAGPRARRGEESVLRAEKICRRLGIEHVAQDCSAAFFEKVVAAFVDGYRAGTTPNPCITCNEKIKFPGLAAAAERTGCSRIATGHYARIVRDESGKALLAASPDAGKDQSYFLYRVPASLLERTIFPLQDMSKEDVRSFAERRGLLEPGTGESQDVCFLEGAGLGAFLSGHLPGREGAVVDGEGRTVGRHAGIHTVTIGQRKGLGISAERPLYVTGIDAERNLVTLGPEEALYSAAAVCRGVRMRFRSVGGAIRAKIRYRHEAAEVERIERSAGSMRVVFRRPQRAVTPGQSVVLYRGGIVVGGGVISSSER